MGTVFKAHDRLLGETVALKVARDGRIEDRLLDRMRAEVKLARTVRHPNVCAVHDYGEDGGLVFLSMAYLTGRDLRTLIQERGGLNWEEAYALVLQVADGLVAIHDAGVIHRDLKPANVMVDDRGMARVVDFGVAHWRGDGVASGSGAPGYMSPEQVRGGPIDARSDLYSFACLVYETFTSWPPFVADTPLATMLKQVEEPPPLHGASGLRLPRSIVPVLARALAKQPVDRYATAAEMREALREARTSLSVDTTDAFPRPSAGEPPPQKPDPGRDSASEGGHPSRSSSSRAVASWIALSVVAGAALAVVGRERPMAPQGGLPPAAAATPSPLDAAPTPPPSAHRATAAPRKLGLQAMVAPITQPPPQEIVDEGASGRTALAPIVPATPTPEAPEPTPPSTLELRAQSPEPVVDEGSLVDRNDPHVRLPECLSCPHPRTPLIAEHPEVAPRLKGKGHVVLDLLVDERGRVAEVRPLNEVEILTAAAVKAVRKWRYRPATKRGVAVKVWIGVPIRFVLPGDPRPLEDDPRKDRPPRPPFESPAAGGRDGLQ